MLWNHLSFQQKVASIRYTVVIHLPVYIYFLLHFTHMLYFYFELPVFNRFCDKIALDESDELASLCHVLGPRNENISCLFKKLDTRELTYPPKMQF